MNLALARDFAGPAAAAEVRPDDAPIDLAVRGLAARYGDRPYVFSEVSFEVRRGEAVALIGANGAGKSTLLKCCLGFVNPAAGEIVRLGQPVAVGGHGIARGRLGFVAQKHNLVARFSVLSNVVNGFLGPRPGPRSWMHALAPRAARQQALAALERVGLADLALQRVDTLSGGQSQRVAIARALVAEPRLIFADEPAASLDPAAGDEVMDLFRRVVRDSGATLVFTTHNLSHAIAFGDRILGLRDGRLALDAPSQGIAIAGLRGLYG